MTNADVAARRESESIVPRSTTHRGTAPGRDAIGREIRGTAMIPVASALVVEKLAAGVRRRAGYAWDDVVDAVHVARVLDLPVYVSSEITFVPGYYVTKHREVHITPPVNEKRVLRHDVVSHEIGHHVFSALVRRRSDRRLVGSDAGVEDHTLNERCANWFSAALLFAPKLVEAIDARRITARRVAETCGVLPTLVGVRRAQIRYITRHAAETIDGHRRAGIRHDKAFTRALAESS